MSSIEARLLALENAFAKHIHFAGGEPGNVSGWKAESLKLIGEMHEEAERLAKMADSLPAEIDQVAYWQRNAAYWKRQHEENVAAQMARAQKAEQDLAEERNHREKAENIARTAASQRDEARANLTNLTEAAGEFQTKIRQALGMEPIMGDAVVEVQRLVTEVERLKNIVVDIGGIGGCQDKINPIKAVGVIAHLQAELQQAKMRISESDADCVKTLQERDELRKQITILGEAGRDARADAEKAKAERNALSNEYHDLQSLKDEVQQLKADLSRICTQRDEALNDRDDARSTVNSLTKDILHVKAELERESAEAQKLFNERNDLKKERDNVYTERNRVVAAFARLAVSFGWLVSVTKTAIEGWDAAWHNCIFVETPFGQMSWHFHDSEAHFFLNLPHGDAKWDGHTTEQKYRRLENLVSSYDTTDESLMKFKTLVHNRLDTMGIPKFEGADCRIGARLDEVARRITLTHISESFGRAFGDALKEIADTWRKL